MIPFCGDPENILGDVQNSFAVVLRTRAEGGVSSLRRAAVCGLISQKAQAAKGEKQEPRPQAWLPMVIHER